MTCIVTKLIKPVSFSNGIVFSPDCEQHLDQDVLSTGHGGQVKQSVSMVERALSNHIVASTIVVKIV